MKIKYIQKLIILIITLPLISFSQKKLSDDNKEKFDDFFFKAMKEKSEKNYISEIMYLEMCEKIDSTEFTIFFELGKAYFIIKDLKKTEENLLKSYHLQQNNKYILEALVGYYDFISHKEKTIQWLEKLCVIDSNYDRNLLEKYIILEKYDKALTLVNKLMVDEKYKIDYLVIKKDIYYSQGNYQGAINICKELIKLEPENENWILAEVYIYSSTNEEKKAIELLISYNKQYPNSPLVNLSLVNFYLKNNDIGKSIKHLSKIIKNDNVKEDIKVESIYSILNTKSRIDSLRSYLSEIISYLEENKDNNIKYSLLLYQYYKKYNDYKNSYKWIKYFINNSKEPPSQELYIQYLLSIGSMEDNELLYTESTKVIELFPLYSFPYLIKANVSIILKRKDKEILNLINNGLSLVNDNKIIESEFYVIKGDLYNRKKEYKESDEFFEKSILLNPANYLSMNNYSYFLSLRNENLDKAKDFMDIVINKNPNNPTYLDTYAWVLYKLKEYRKSLECIIRAISIMESDKNEKDSYELREHYGDILIKNNLKAEAIEQWKKAIELGGKKRIIRKKIKDAE